MRDSTHSRRSRPEAADELRCPGGVAFCSETVEGGERELRFAEGDLGAPFRDCLRELEAGTRTSYGSSRVE